MRFFDPLQADVVRFDIFFVRLDQARDTRTIYIHVYTNFVVIVCVSMCCACVNGCMTEIAASMVLVHMKNWI